MWMTVLSWTADNDEYPTDIWNISSIDVTSLLRSVLLVTYFVVFDQADNGLWP